MKKVTQYSITLLACLITMHIQAAHSNGFFASAKESMSNGWQKVTGWFSRSPQEKELADTQLPDQMVDTTKNTKSPEDAGSLEITAPEAPNEDSLTHSVPVEPEKITEEDLVDLLRQLEEELAPHEESVTKKPVEIDNEPAHMIWAPRTNAIKDEEITITPPPSQRQFTTTATIDDMNAEEIEQLLQELEALTSDVDNAA